MMRSLLIACMLALSACSTLSSPAAIPAPVELANRTAVDEEARNGVELGYKAFRLALELGVDAGVIKGERAVKAAAADRQAYNALLIFREAYKTANAADLLAAGRSANIAIAQAIAAVRGN